MEKEMGEIELYHFHHHPLTFIDNENEYERPKCPVCKYGFLFDRYNCSECVFHAEDCSACGGEPSGSFYICKRCLPGSPFFHKFCAELPPQIQIALRHHCILHWVNEASSFLSNIPFHCDFCDKIQKGCKFCCDFCNFRICAPCATSLMKYHQDRQVVQHFSHHHPLILLDMEMEDNACQMCYQIILGESYCCSPCEFYIHKSCRELQQEVQHSFHPGHSLTLQLQKYASLGKTYYCAACCSKIDRGIHYRCVDCNFNMHSTCISLKSNIKYEEHQHTVILVENMYHESECQACGFEIEATFFVRCVQCRLDFHVRCGAPAWLPPSTVVNVHHDHPLILTTETVIEDDSDLYCDICKDGIEPKDSSYGCVACQYYSHVRCVITEIQLDRREKVKYFFHNCLLFLLEDNISDDIKCNGCNKLIQAHPAYGCDDCRFYLHKSCFELPKVIYDISHSHYLTLQDSSDSKQGVCKACGTHLDGRIYRCETCDFDLDLDCASQHPSIKWKTCSDECTYDEDRQLIGHYSHYHHLTLLEVGDMDCKLCYKNIQGPSYGCAPCLFYIHKSCGELPQEVRHPFHPRHYLTLQENTDSNAYICDACDLPVNPGMRYRCNICEFDLHLECVLLKPNIKYEDHQHLVILVENMSYIGKCQACRCKIEGTFFVRCVECGLDFHVQCGPDSLPPTVVHPHHNHPLTVTIETIIKDDYGLLYCDVCKEERNPNHPSYTCVECEYYAHVRCVVAQVPLDEREKLEHFSHDHFLFLVGNERNHDDILCYACEELIQAYPAYGCDPCRFYLHKSCVELPRQIQHLFHRHPLTLNSHPDKGTKYHQCGSCNKNLRGFFYQCDNCFVMDVDCAQLRLADKFEGNVHTLTLFQKLQHTPECRKYISATTGALDQSCVKCNFIVYLFRSPLPQTIECSSHIHSLTLVDIVDDDKYDRQICDVCEEERDPEVCVYYCTECDFVAEFVCVISEVILAPQKKHRDVQLRSTVKEISKSLTFNDVDSFTDEEDQIFKEILQALAEEMEEILNKFSGAGQEAKVGTSGKSVYSDHEGFLQSLADISDDDRLSLLQVEDYKCEVVDVRGYKTIPRFAGILKNVLDKYGDIGSSCNLDQGVSNLKMFMIVYLCATVHSMCNTMIQDVDDLLLCTWWKIFYMAHLTGFRVEFIFDHLKRIAQVRQRFILIDTELLKFKTIHYCSSEKTKLYKEIDGLANEIDNQKGNVELINKQTQKEISNIRLEKMRLEAERLSNDWEIGMVKAGIHTGLL